jgi:hypothetical protein
LSPVRAIALLARLPQSPRRTEVLRAAGLRRLPGLPAVLVAAAVSQVPDLPGPDAEGLGAAAAGEVQDRYLESGDRDAVDGGGDEGRRGVAGEEMRTPQDGD